MILIVYFLKEIFMSEPENEEEHRDGPGANSIVQGETYKHSNNTPSSCFDNTDGDHAWKSLLKTLEQEL